MKDRMIPRLISLCLCGLILLTAAACRGGELPDVTDSETTETETTAQDTCPEDLPEETEKDSPAETGQDTESEAGTTSMPEESGSTDTSGIEPPADTLVGSEEITKDPNQGEWDPQP